MQSREIPRDQWVSFLDTFSRQHEGSRVTVEVTQDGTSGKTEARELPLQGIAANLKHGDKDTIEIILGSQKDEYITHALSKVKHIRVLSDQSGESGLEIEGAEGKAILELQSNEMSRSNR